MITTIAVLTLTVTSVLFMYLSRLSARLRGVSTKPKTSQLTLESLDKVSYKDVDMLKAIPQATHTGYAVIGGSGFVGTYIVRLLLLRGETNIRILDLHPPSTQLDSRVSFVKTDITSLDSLRKALTLPFDATGAPPTVIFFTAASIRFYERRSYCWPASYNINVVGTANVLSVARELPDAIVVYTSTSDTILPRSGVAHEERIGDSDDDSSAFEPRQLVHSCYARSKRMAEELVKQADGQGGVRTGILRPGYTILGPNDRMICSTLTMPRVPVYDAEWSSTSICVWDAAAAHLLLEDAIRRIPNEAAGKAFLISGDGPPWSLGEVRRAIKYYSPRDIILDEISPMFIYPLSYVVEAFLWLRYHILLPFSLLAWSKPSLYPKWMGQLVLLQPCTLESQLIHVVIDDSRARKVLGYRPQWEMAQIIRYTVDEVESGRAERRHGVQLG